MVEDLVVEILITEPVGITTLQATGPSQRARSLRSNEFDGLDNMVMRRSKTQALIK